MHKRGSGDVLALAVLDLVLSTKKRARFFRVYLRHVRLSETMDSGDWGGGGGFGRVSLVEILFSHVALHRGARAAETAPK